MKTRSDGRPIYYAATVADWRAWLARYGAEQPGVWLIIYRKDNAKVPKRFPTPSKISRKNVSIDYPTAVDHALCYGWIDSKPNKRDHESYFQYFSPRNPKSNWSRVNKEKVARLEAAGLIAPPGRAMIELAKATGTWTALDDVENLVIDPDLRAAFDAAPPAARTNWEAFPRSAKRGILEWIFNAKRAPTRAKRIAETVALAAKNERANQYRK